VRGLRVACMRVHDKLQTSEKRGETYRTIPANTRSFSHHPFTSLRATTCRQDAHSSVDGADGREIKNAESTIWGSGVLLVAAREERYRSACRIVKAPREEPTYNVWLVGGILCQGKTYQDDRTLTLHLLLEDFS
jgi:hypothetical protein